MKSSHPNHNSQATTELNPRRSSRRRSLEGPLAPSPAFASNLSSEPSSVSSARSITFVSNSDVGRFIPPKTANDVRRLTAVQIKSLNVSAFIGMNEAILAFTDAQIVHIDKDIIVDFEILRSNVMISAQLKKDKEQAEERAEVLAKEIWTLNRTLASYSQKMKLFYEEFKNEDIKNEVICDKAKALAQTMFDEVKVIVEDEIKNSQDAHQRRIVRDIVNCKPVIDLPAEPSWDKQGADRSSSKSGSDRSSTATALFKSKSPETATSWLDFYGTHVKDWDDDAFIATLTSIDTPLLDMFLDLDVSYFLEKQLDGTFLGKLAGARYARLEIMVENLLQFGVWHPLWELTRDTAKSGIEVMTAQGNADIDTYVAVAPQYKGTMIPDRFVVTKRKGVTDKSELVNRFDDGHCDPLDVPGQASTYGEGGKDEMKLAKGNYGFLVVEIKPDYLCPRPKNSHRKDLDSAKVTRRNEILKQGVAAYVRATPEDGITLEEILSQNVASQVGTYAMTTGLKYVAICTLNTITYGYVETRNVQQATTSDDQDALASDVGARTPLTTASSEGDSIKTEHVMYLTRKFDWSSEENPLNGWSHWEILVRMFLATLKDSFLKSVPDTLKIKAREKTSARRRGSGKKADRKDSSNNGGGPNGGSGNSGDGSGKGGDSRHGGGPGRGSPPDDEDDDGIDGEPDSKRTRGDAAFGRKKAGGVIEASTSEDVEHFEQFLPLSWAELWDERRFAVPATHTREEENTQEHLPGDAMLLSRSRVGPVYRQLLRGKYDTVVKVALVHDPEREKHDPRYEAIVEELKHEANVYDRLESLQAKQIPRMFWQGSIICGMIEGLATEYSGRCFEDDDVKMSLVLVERALDALDAIHELGVIHRDLKLSNVVVGDDASVKIIDFGLSKMYAFPLSDVFRNAAAKERRGFEQQLAIAIQPDSTSSPFPDVNVPLPNKHGSNANGPRKRRRSPRRESHEI